MYPVDFHYLPEDMLYEGTAQDGLPSLETIMDLKKISVLTYV